MKHLILLRHGDCSNSKPYPLTPKGVTQYETLGDDIKTVTNDGSSHIITSPAIRAYQGGLILPQKLKTVSPVEKLLFLWDATDKPEEYEGKKVGTDDLYYYMSFYTPKEAKEKLERIVDERANLADVLIMISHKDLIYQFCHYYTDKHFGRAESFSFEYGEGVHLDLETKKCIKLPLPVNPDK